MQNSSAFCRAQEAHHRQRAADTELANVKSVATSAATAWGIEAISAERREERHVKRQADAAAAPAPAGDQTPDDGADGEPV